MTEQPPSAERPAPPQQQNLRELLGGSSAAVSETWSLGGSDLPRRVDVQQPTQETGDPGCGEARYCTNLKYRDDFIVSRGLWAEFVASLPPYALASTGEQPDKEEDFGEGSVTTASATPPSPPAVVDYTEPERPCLADRSLTEPEGPASNSGAAQAAVVDYTTGDCPCGYGWNCKETGCRRPPPRDPNAWSDADA